jgi:hypothetical protein
MPTQVTRRRGPTVAIIVRVLATTARPNNDAEVPLAFEEGILLREKGGYFTAAGKCE